MERDSENEPPQSAARSMTPDVSSAGTAAEPSAPPSRRLHPVVILVANVGLFALLWLGIELATQALFPRDLHAVFDDAGFRARDFVVQDATRGFALKPGYDVPPIRINSAGFRGPELPNDLGDRTVVLALGESSTFGSGVVEDESYPAHLQHFLERQPRMRPAYVINGGVPSYTSPQVLLYLQQVVPRYRPAVVVISVLWNDALYACLGNWMPDYLVHQRPAAWRRFLLRHSAVFRALVIRDRVLAPGGHVENPKALRFYERNLSEMVRVCRRAHVQVVLLRPSLDPNHVHSDGVRIGSGIVPKRDFLELLDSFMKVEKRVADREGVLLVTHRLTNGGSSMSSVFIDPVHLNGEGNAMLAEDVAKALVGSKALPPQ